MKHVVSLLFTSSKNNFDTTIDFFGETVRISQFGADFDPETLEALLRTYDGRCDVIAISGLQLPVKIGRKTHYHPDSLRYLQIPQQTPVITGALFRRVFIPWAIQNQVRRKKLHLENRKVAFLSGLTDQEIAFAIAPYTDRIYFFDPVYHLGTPIVLKGIKELDTYAKGLLPILKKIKLGNVRRNIDLRVLKTTKRVREARRADFCVASATLLERADLQALRGRTLIVDALSSSLELRLRDAKVKDVIEIVPKIKDVTIPSGLRYALFEALIHINKGKDRALEEDDLIEFITDHQLTPELISITHDTYKPVRKFAFIVHPLSVRDFFRHPLLRGLLPLTRIVEKPLEKGLSKLHGARYGKIRGIMSTHDGTRVEGIIYTLFDTPRQMLATEPDKVYKKLVDLCDLASREGADIIGLGAFTKVVGDAGVTVASLSPIPVTTGNSLSASSALWAARVAVEKMGFLPPFTIPAENPVGTAMVVGAAGSIGKASAKLLARVAKKLILVSRGSAKLLELRDEIKASNTGCTIELSTNPDKHAGECDLIILATSSIDGGVLNIDSIKPGCVVSDVSRPLTYSAEEAMRRPDVLLIESGEVQLPGPVEITCDIGLDETVVYACLAETALLALEGRFESFTLSRNISFDRVREIYDMAKKHGAQLAAIRGPSGLITDHEIELCRHHALEALKNWQPKHQL